MLKGSRTVHNLPTHGRGIGSPSGLPQIEATVQRSRGNNSVQRELGLDTIRRNVTASTHTGVLGHLMHWRDRLGPKRPALRPVGTFAPESTNIGVKTTKYGANQPRAGQNPR